MWLDQAATWELPRSSAEKPLFESIQRDTLTCHMGDRSVKYASGFGCDSCSAHELRSKGYASLDAEAMA